METFDRQYFLSSRRRKYNVSLLANWGIFPIWQLLVPATQDLLGLFHPWSFTVYNTFSPVVQQLHYIELCHFKMVYISYHDFWAITDKILKAKITTM